MQILEKNIPSPFTWQGNNFGTPIWVNYIFVGAVFFAFIYLWAKRIKIANSNELQTRKFLIFRNTDVMLRVISVLWLSLAIAKAVLYFISGYPLTWEHIPLHLCRTHAYLIPIFILIGKKKWMKYIVFPALLGSIIGMAFWKIDFADDSLPINIIAKSDGFTFYRLGFDSLLWWEFWITHLLVAILPTYIIIANTVRISWRDILISTIVYAIIFALLWTTNTVTNIFIDDPKWQTNFFYSGLDVSNGYSDLFGPLTKWPYPIIAYPPTFALFNVVAYRFSIWLSNFRYKENNQFIYRIKSETQMIYEANRTKEFWKKPEYK